MLKQKKGTFIEIDKNKKILRITSGLNKHTLKKVINSTPLDKKQLLISLIAGIIAGAILALLR